MIIFTALGGSSVANRKRTNTVRSKLRCEDFTGEVLRLRENTVEALSRRGYSGRSPDKQHGAEL